MDATATVTAMPTHIHLIAADATAKRDSYVPASVDSSSNDTLLVSGPGLADNLTTAAANAILAQPEGNDTTFSHAVDDSNASQRARVGHKETE